MKLQSQALLENELDLRWEEVQNGKLSLQQAFGVFDDWSIELGVRRAFLHPNLKQWLWYEKIHDDWVSAGCVPGEGILLTIGKTAGMKKLPQPGAVDDWCVYQADQKLYGAILIKELHAKITSRKIPPDSLIWSTRATQWLKIGDSDGKVLSFINNAGEMVLQVNPDGQFIEPSSKTKSARKVKAS